MSAQLSCRSGLRLGRALRLSQHAVQAIVFKRGMADRSTGRPARGAGIARPVAGDYFRVLLQAAAGRGCGEAHHNGHGSAARGQLGRDLRINRLNYHLTGKYLSVTSSPRAGLEVVILDLALSVCSHDE